MNWNTSNRRSELPSNWGSIRKRVFKLKGAFCVNVLHDGFPCGDYATDIDHIVPGNNHSISNLQPVCRKCHSGKSSREGFLAYRALRKRVAASVEDSFGWGEEHPSRQVDEVFKHPWQV